MAMKNVLQTRKMIAQSNGVEDTPLLAAILTYMSYAIIAIAGIILDVLIFVGVIRNFKPPDPNKDFVRLYRSFESFYTRSMYFRVRHMFGRPICSNPTAHVDVVDRVSHDRNWTFRPTGKIRKCLNMGSYNYLGFADNCDHCRIGVQRCISREGVATCMPYREMGQHSIQRRLEKELAAFLRTEDCITFGMGFATNSCNIPALVSKGCLVVSDEFNHSSLVLGVRMSGARVIVFPHNDIAALEQIIRQAIIDGQPKSHRPWRKILIIVEGVYSMEGTISNLPELIRLKKKYKAYLYLDEAHSIGAIGPNGRGVVDYFGCNPKDVDILMGTFTKSFASAGGYIAGCKKLIQHIRKHSHANFYASAMSPAVCEQIMLTMSIISGKSCPGEGQRRIKALAWNSRYFYDKLKENGFIVYGKGDSPVIPLMIYMPGKFLYILEELYKRNIAVVGVGFPATRLVESRIRFCVSAGHTKEMLDELVDILVDLGDRCGLRYRKSFLF